MPSTQSTPPLFRFAPSPNGLLHLGHALSALLNHDMAHEADGRFLLRIEDIDTTRCTPDFEAAIYRDLAWLGLAWETPVRRQSEHFDLYRQALDRLKGLGLVYPAFLTRGEVKARVSEFEAGGREWPRDPDGSPLYPSDDRERSEAERQRLMGEGIRHAWRLDVNKALALIGEPIATPITDEKSPSGLPAISPTRGETRSGNRLPRLSLDGATGLSPPPCGEGGEGSSPMALPTVPLSWQETGDGEGRSIPAEPALWGDVVLSRSDAPSSYHLSVVVDDALQGITHVVRGQDLYAATAVHRLLQRLLDLPEPVYHHHRLILGNDGRKLSKSEGSTGIAALRDDGLTPADIRRLVGL